MARKLVFLVVVAICFVAVIHAEETETELDCDKLCDQNGIEFTGPVCGNVDGQFTPFINDCERRKMACKTKKDVLLVDHDKCDFPADFGVDPKWIGK